MLVRLTETAQVRNDDGAGGQQRGDFAVIVAIARPAMDQDHAVARARAVVDQFEAIDRRRSGTPTA